MAEKQLKTTKKTIMETNVEKEAFLNLMNYMSLDEWDKALDEILDCIIDGIDDCGEMSQMPMYNVRWLQKIIRALKESSNSGALVQSITEKLVGKHKIENAKQNE